MPRTSDAAPPRGIPEQVRRYHGFRLFTAYWSPASDAPRSCGNVIYATYHLYTILKFCTSLIPFFFFISMNWFTWSVPAEIALPWKLSWSWSWPWPYSLVDVRHFLKVLWKAITQYEIIILFIVSIYKFARNVKIWFHITLYCVKVLSLKFVPLNV